ncbi:hypothetical protein TPL01_00260 [Sulfuriferula plumbiphila]|uniref:EamA domain-containing protein n=1 Tax=Sulfuriferula plumbiphila TaxID=171865 RepID=A0A512L335_9PROT|nr:EamA family transporter [Sulfuriferula plumbiphila]BBP02594.1 hypothetical protein SFPGR_00160 [Sulfuriferula plumbiphila]GEP28888.1 hypothetical protein TPL01_00260 [Sulfuriferula plumbiphila]
MVVPAGIKPREKLALILSYAGIALVFVHDVGMRENGVWTGALLVFGSALAYAIYLIGANHSIARIGAGTTALIGAIGPVSTIYLAWVFLGEGVSLTQITGSMLVLAGVLAISIKRGGR